MCSIPLRRYDDAIRYLEKATASLIRNSWRQASVAQCYAAKGDKAGEIRASRMALARIEKVIIAEPDHGHALGYGACLLAALGEPDRAKEWIERGTLVNPNNTTQQFNCVCALDPPE